MTSMAHKFSSEDWNSKREALEAALITAAGDLITHSESAQATVEKEWISVTVRLVDYKGLKS